MVKTIMLCSVAAMLTACTTVHTPQQGGKEEQWGQSLRSIFDYRIEMYLRWVEDVAAGRTRLRTEAILRHAHELRQVYEDERRAAMAGDRSDAGTEHIIDLVPTDAPTDMRCPFPFYAFRHDGMRYLTLEEAEAIGEIIWSLRDADSVPDKDMRRLRRLFHLKDK